MNQHPPQNAGSGLGDPANPFVFHDFYDLLGEFSAYEQIGTEDVLAALLPLMRQALEQHEHDRVAPLDGVEALRVARGKLWFENAAAKAPQRRAYEISQVQGSSLAFEVTDSWSVERGENSVSVQSRLIGTRGQVPTSPLYLPDYRCWEHAIGHHDPLTDIFSLGMIGASLALGLDFTEEQDLRAFVENRKRLTQINDRLHPVVAQILGKMTELDRSKRAQDLPSLIHALENHRRVHVQSELDLFSNKAFRSENVSERSVRILTELRARLYDMSRRNKLLYHKPATNELNLTEASTPIVLRVEAIRPEQLFTWTGKVATKLAKGDPIQLDEYVRFEEMLFAAPTLDKIRSQARKDEHEYGFSQLRLVTCFLRWRNLKEEPDEPISSPLLLLPVKLTKTRKVRDSYTLQATSNHAEINPTLRRHLQQLYGMKLPASIDLSDASAIDALYDSLREQIMQSEPGVKLDKIDRPQINLMYNRAQRRVNLYRKRQKRSGANLKTFNEAISYSYSRARFAPLGEQLYHAYVAPPRAPGRELTIQPSLALSMPRMAAEAAQSATEDKERRKATRSKTGESRTYAFAEPGTQDKYGWAFDLCSVTLANFNYRKMSLVRDYDALIEAPLPANDSAPDRAQVFEKLFASNVQKLPVEPTVPALAEQHLVVPSDPTQERAVHRARTGESYVIQGPPGTGKSQTIANLVADYLGRGKRVLFVCEKRAALDVVYHRLEGLGLHKLCALVHDSQEDKRDFVTDLKGLYETWLTEELDPAASKARASAVQEIEAGLRTLGEIDEDMRAQIDGEPFYSLIETAAGRRQLGHDGTSLLGTERALIPPISEWNMGREAALEMERALEKLGFEPILAKHPARFVSTQAATDPELFARMTEALRDLGQHLERIEAGADLVLWEEKSTAPLAALFAQIDLADRLAPVAAARKLALLNPDSLQADSFRNDLRWLRESREALERSLEKTSFWRDKLSAMETDTALMLAMRYEGKVMSFLSGPWRQVKKEVTDRAGLESMSIKPQLRDILSDLAKEHEIARDVERALKQLADNAGLEDGEAAIALVEERDSGIPREGSYAAPLLDEVAREGDRTLDRLRGLAQLKPAADAARQTITACFEGLETLPADKAFRALTELESAKDMLPGFAPALRALAEAPHAVRTALRRLEAPVASIETAVVENAVDRALIQRPALREVDGTRLDASGARLADALTRFRASNALVLLEQARARFIEHLRQATQIDGNDAEKKAVLKAQGDLEREFQKTMRFRSVRELLSGPAGRLIPDLKPIWLMSPLSVADILPLDAQFFDVAIFDEASQVPVEEAAPTLFRAPQVIVVGDEKQLPPTNFFGSSGSSDAQDDLFDNEEENVIEVDLDADSFLTQAAKALPSTLLGWHYRSRSEELIAFSNAIFYSGKLISVPSTRRSQNAKPIAPSSADEGGKTWKEILTRPVSFHHTEFATYERQRNRGEAQYIAEMVRGLLLKGDGQTIGVVAFSEAQQTAIEQAMNALAKADKKFASRLEEEMERIEDGQFVGLFVKNLENVQGDERDIIIVSVCYAPDRSGAMRMNFGPINRAGGEKRLNVIFSRAREHIALVSTIRGDRITNDYNTGAFSLKTYLRYAEAVSTGDQEAMRRALAAAAPHAVEVKRQSAGEVAEQIAASLKARGYEVDTGLGESGFVCDLAVRRAGETDHELAILIDGRKHYQNPNLLERHVTKPSVLNAFGWRVMSVLGLDWRRDPEGVINRIEAALRV
ncbi:MAG: AAA domain-containing protein [Neomegalonema sp.]|nr:AAA domain-containing protein [Neomegalonema sp.]